MFKTVFSFLLLIVFQQGFSQNSIGDSRPRVKKYLERYIRKNKVTETIQETDSTVYIAFRNAQFKTADFIYHFDKDNKCDYELKIACDTCMLKYLDAAMDFKYYDWKQVTPTSFVSKYSSHLLIELFSEKEQYSILIRKIYLSKEAFRQLTDSEIKRS